MANIQKIREMEEEPLSATKSSNSLSIKPAYSSPPGTYSAYHSSFLTTTSPSSVTKSRSSQHITSSSLFSTSPRKGTNDHLNGEAAQIENVWNDLKQRVFPLFNGEGLKGSLEDLNDLIKILLKAAPATVLSEKLADLIKIGMNFFTGKLSTVAPEKLASRTAEIWTFFYGTVIPYFQGVFLPLEVELRYQHVNESSVRRMLLAAFRDCFVLQYLDKITEATQKLLTDQDEGRKSDILGRILQMLTVLNSEIRDDSQVKFVNALNVLTCALPQ